MRHEPDDYLLPDRRRPRVLTYERAREAVKPRRCNVPWDRRGGRSCCDLCVNQYLTAKHVACIASEESPLFRPRRKDWDGGASS